METLEAGASGPEQATEQMLRGDGKPANSLQPSKMPRDQLYQTLKQWLLADRDHSASWRAQAKKDFDFVAGEQWDAADRSYLEEQGRPVIVFNRVLSMIKAIAGIEINGRTETIFLPHGTEPGPIVANEMLSNASNWMSEGCDSPDEQSDAFQKASICGMGWTEQVIEGDQDPDGKYIERSLDPLEMYWDRSARSKNLADSRRMARVRKIDLQMARDMFPGKLDSDLDAAWITGVDANDPVPVEERLKRLENVAAHDPRLEVTIAHVQWIERESYWRVANPATPGSSLIDVTDEEHTELKKRAEALGMELSSVQAVRRKYMYAFLGGTGVLQMGESPCQTGFTYNCITGEPHHNKGTWFGIISVVRDPQMWANKWLSQTLHILNSTAKGGILAEEDAFPDIRQAESTYARPDAITWVAHNAIKDGKIMAKPGTGLPSGYINLLTFALDSIREVSGINMELLGMRNANQPGVLEDTRKQAAITILATLFDSLRRYRKLNGRVRLYFIQEYLADGRLIRVAGQEAMQVLPLIRDKTLGKYDVVVSEAPTSPSQKEQTWRILKDLLPIFQTLMSPEAALVLLEYSPLPTKVTEQLKKLVAESKQPDPMAEAAKKLQLGAVSAKIDKDKSSAEESRASALEKRIEAALKLMTGVTPVEDAGPSQGQPAQQPAETMQDIDGEWAIPPAQSAMQQVPQLPRLPTRGGGF